MPAPRPERSPTNCSPPTSGPRRNAAGSRAPSRPCSGPRFCRASAVGVVSETPSLARRAPTTTPTPRRTLRASTPRSTAYQRKIRELNHACLASPRRRSSSSAAASSAARRPIISARDHKADVIAARAEQAHLRLDLARGGPCRPTALVGLDHAGAQILGRALQEPQGGNRPRNRLENDRMPAGSRRTRTAGPNSGGCATTAKNFGMDVALALARRG